MDHNCSKSGAENPRGWSGGCEARHQLRFRYLIDRKSTDVREGGWERGGPGSCEAFCGHDSVMKVACSIARGRSMKLAWLRHLLGSERKEGRWR